jgi:hypothetical protein
MAEKLDGLSWAILVSAALIAFSILGSSLIEIGGTRGSPIGTWQPIGVEKGAGWIVNTQTGTMRACWPDHKCYTMNK